jgi:hypothetical protein
VRGVGGAEASHIGKAACRRGGMPKRDGRNWKSGILRSRMRSPGHLRKADRYAESLERNAFPCLHRRTRSVLQSRDHLSDLIDLLRCYQTTSCVHTER